MNILIPIIGFGKAGGYRVLSELANNWIKLGHEVHFLVDRRSPPPYFPTRANILQFDPEGIVAEKDELEKFKGYAVEGNARSIYVSMWKALKKLDRKYDVIIANHSLTTYPIFLSFVKVTKKFYYVQAYEPEYYSEKKDFKSGVLKCLSYFSYWLPFEKIVNAPIYLKYKNLSAKNWVPPGIDETIFFRRDHPPEFNAGKPITIGVIGRVEPEKGTRFVLDAFSSIAKRNKYAVLKIAFGNLPNTWNHDRAEVVIPKNDSELGEYYRSVDILVAPGTLQLGACHYPVLEAMACGTPVITTGYLPANSENSWMVGVGNSKDIEVAIRKIIETPKEEMISKLDRAYRDVSEFHWKNVATKFLKMIA